MRRAPPERRDGKWPLCQANARHVNSKLGLRQARDAETQSTGGHQAFEGLTSVEALGFRGSSVGWVKVGVLFGAHLEVG